MSEPIASAAPPKRLSVVKCERHGLHYDPAKTSGCVICRRESGDVCVRARIELPRFRTYVRPLLVAAGLILGVGLALYGLHDAAAVYVRTSGTFGAAGAPDRLVASAPTRKSL